MSTRSRRQPVSTDKRFRKNNNGSDFGPLERWQHSSRTLEITETAGKLAARATEEHILDILVMRRVITMRQREAALLMKLDYHRAGLAAHVTSSYNPMRANKDYVYSAPERDNVQEAAYQRWRNAVRAMGMIYGDVLISTACHDLLPTPRDITTLQNGLNKLADWYRLPKTDKT